MQRFKNTGGVIGLRKPFPKRMTWKKALELSIEKWEFVKAEGSAVDWCGGGYTCALCRRAGFESGEANCNICPVGKKTGEDRDAARRK